MYLLQVIKTKVNGTEAPEYQYCLKYSNTK